MDDIAIKVDDVSKTFKLPHEKRSSIKSAFVNIFRPQKGYEIQEALKDISFEVKHGEFFGIVGRNGGGKSTLLKLLAGIYTPTNGWVQVNGKLTPFIELGVGFNPELTGRENVFLNGALLGFNRKEMQVMYKDIVDFAELEKFMDQKLKNYSSGMQVRLAFSIAIRADTDILLIDEVLAVGDEAFQRKCLNIFEEYKAKNRTVILVTHDMSTVEKFCTRAMLLHNGELKDIGDPRRIAKEYRDINERSSEKLLAEENQKKENHTKLAILGSKGKQAKFTYGERAVISMEWEKSSRIGGVGIAILKQSGEYIFGTNTFLDMVSVSGKKKINYSVNLDLGPGTFIVKTALFGKDDSEVIKFIDNGPKFVMEEPPKGLNWGGLVHLPHKWE